MADVQQAAERRDRAHRRLHIHQSHPGSASSSESLKIRMSRVRHVAETDAETIMVLIPWFFCSNILLLSSMSFSGIPSMPYISSSISILPGIALGTPSMVSLCTYTCKVVQRGNFTARRHDLA